MSLPQRKVEIAPKKINLRNNSDPFSDIAEDVRKGLTSNPKVLNPKYFYDEEGSKLFDEITRLPEYYPTRTETKILAKESERLIAKYTPEAIFELGSGSATKTNMILEPMTKMGLLKGIGLLDFNEEFLKESSLNFQISYPNAEIMSVVGDFSKKLSFDSFEYSPTLYLILGSTIGNMNQGESIKFLKRVAEKMRASDYFLLGTDLIKDEKSLYEAYNDSQNVTAKFNKNILKVINDKLGADFDPALFDHEAIYNHSKNRIEMYLISDSYQKIYIKDLDLEIEIERGEKICTEICRKYDRQKVKAMLEPAGMEIIEWLTDEDSLYALSLCKLI